MKGTLAASVLALLIFQSAGCADDWPVLGHDAARSGATSEEVRPPFARKWYRLFPEEGIQTGVQPVVAEGIVFIGTLRGVMHAIDSETGRDVWSVEAGAPILHSAAVHSGKVYFGCADGSVRALRSSDGKGVWKTQTGAAVWNAPVTHQGLVLIGGRDGRLYALDELSGAIRWDADLGAPVLNSPAIDAKSKVVYAGSEAMRVHAIRLSDGREMWRSAPLPGSSMRGYHPVIAPDGSVLVTTAPVIGYDRFQELLLQMARTVFGDFASWRHTREENEKLRAENFRLMERPETYTSQLDYIRERLTAEPAFQTFFVLDPETGRQRFVAPIVSSESMNGPAAPPIVTPQGKVIVKYQVLLRSRYEHYSPFLNVGYLDTRTGRIEPIMDQTRTYGWHDSLLLVHDEQCQLSCAGRLLFNTHQDNVNAMDLETLEGFPEPLALNVHEPAPGEAFATRIAAWRGEDLPPGEEWIIRGTAVYGGGSVLDVPAVIAGGSFYYLPTHELNSGCALIAYRAVAAGPAPRRPPMAVPQLKPDEWAKLQDLPWDWDTLRTARLTNFLASLPGPIAGTPLAPLTGEARKGVESITDEELDELIWSPAFDPGATMSAGEIADGQLTEKLRGAVQELLTTEWRPLVTPAAKAPEFAYCFFNDPAHTVYTLLLARPFLPAQAQEAVDNHVNRILSQSMNRPYRKNQGEPREAYSVPQTLMRIVDESILDELSNCYPLWMWSRTSAGAGSVAGQWTRLRGLLPLAPPGVSDDCGNARLAGLIGFCRLAKGVKDEAALAEALPITREAMRDRVLYELANTRGGVIGPLPNGRSAFIRWRHLTPDVARLIARYAGQVEKQLMTQYVDFLRPGWWLAWNVEQMMRNEAPYQLPSTPLEIFAARALILGEPAHGLERYLDLPWCRGDEFYVEKLALTLRARRK